MSQLPLELTRLGVAGVEWTRKFLENWGGGLSRAVLRELDLSAGTVYGYLPPGSEPKDVGRFAEILTPSPGAASFDAALLLARAIGGELLIVEIGDRRKFRDVGATRRGKKLLAENVVYSGNEILLWRRIWDGSADDVFADIGERDPAFVIGGLQLDSFLPTEDLSEAQLVRLARATRSILVSAFDGDTILVWTNTPLPKTVPTIVFRPTSSEERVARAN